MAKGWRLLICAALWLVAGLCQASPDAVHLKDLPAEVAHTLASVRAGGPFPYAKDGAIFNNFEKRLPRRQRGYYREYTVPTPGARNRGARRIVAGLGATGKTATSGEYYYTGDHYRTFRRIKE